MKRRRGIGDTRGCAPVISGDLLAPRIGGLALWGFPGGEQLARHMKIASQHTQAEVSLKSLRGGSVIHGGPALDKRRQRQIEKVVPSIQILGGVAISSHLFRGSLTLFCPLSKHPVFRKRHNLNGITGLPRRRRTERRFVYRLFMVMYILGNAITFYPASSLKEHFACGAPSDDGGRRPAGASGLRQDQTSSRLEEPLVMVGGSPSNGGNWPLMWTTFAVSESMRI